MRLGVIDIEAIGQHHMRIYNEMDNVNIVGILNISESRVNGLSNQYGVPCFIDYTALLEQDLNAVSVAVPTMLHKQIGLDTVACGANKEYRCC